MAKKKRSFFDDVFDNKMIDDFMGYILTHPEEDPFDSRYKGNTYEEDKDDWKIFAEDGSYYDLDPYDFEYEIEYDIALSKAKKNHWSNFLTLEEQKLVDDGQISTTDYKKYSDFKEEVKQLLEWRESIDPEILKKANSANLDINDYIDEDEFILDAETFYDDWSEYASPNTRQLLIDYDLDPLDYDSEEDMRFQFRIKVMEMTGIVNEMWQRYKKKKPLEIGAILYLAGEKSFADSKLNRDLFYMAVDNRLKEFSLTIQDAERAALYPSVYNINLE